jgi:hypothetical protein
MYIDVNLKTKSQLKSEHGMWEDEVVDVVGECGWGVQKRKCVNLAKIHVVLIGGRT